MRRTAATPVRPSRHRLLTGLAAALACAGVLGVQSAAASTAPAGDPDASVVVGMVLEPGNLDILHTARRRARPGAARQHLRDAAHVRRRGQRRARPRHARRLRRRPHLHADPAGRRHLLRRQAADVGRRQVVARPGALPRRPGGRRQHRPQRATPPRPRRPATPPATSPASPPSTHPTTRPWCSRSPSPTTTARLPAQPARRRRARGGRHRPRELGHRHRPVHARGMEPGLVDHPRPQRQLLGHARRRGRGDVPVLHRPQRRGQRAAGRRRRPAHRRAGGADVAVRGQPRLGGQLHPVER